MAAPSSLPGPVPGVPARGEHTLTDGQRTLWWLARVLLTLAILTLGLALLLPWSWSQVRGTPGVEPPGAVEYAGPLNFALGGVFGLVVLILLMAPGAALLWYLVLLFEPPTPARAAGATVGGVLCCLAALVGAGLTWLVGLAMVVLTDAPVNVGFAGGAYVSWAGYACGLVGLLLALGLFWSVARLQPADGPGAVRFPLPSEGSGSGG